VNFSAILPIQRDNTKNQPIENDDYASFLILKLTRHGANRRQVQFLNHVISIIEQHISDVAFDTFTLAQKCSISRMHLHRKLTTLINLSPRELMRNIRLYRAANLIKENYGTINEIAHLVGFQNVSHFAKRFKELFGETPSKYVKDLYKS
jgi:transcriptional regulator GlxA family with amidase domain